MENAENEYYSEKFLYIDNLLRGKKKYVCILSLNLFLPLATSTWILKWWMNKISANSNGILMFVDYVYWSNIPFMDGWVLNFTWFELGIFEKCKLNLYRKNCNRNFYVTKNQSANEKHITLKNKKIFWIGSYLI